jgi:peptide/nickel transport system substrate-binding protein
VVDEHTVVVLNKEIDPDFLFVLGQATAIIVEPKSADTNATKPVGTGPYQLGLGQGRLGHADRLAGYRNAAAIKHQARHLPLHPDPAAQVAALLAGDVDAFRASRRAACRSSSQPALSGDGQRLARQDHPGHQQRKSRWTTCACAAPSPPPSTARP